MADSTSSTSGNALADQSSPYLLQHADNPVQWYPWDADSLALAREQDKPILLSIGYSACHWCHVMAHESFEDEATAAVMNELFINIKVDREERPDLDKIYQSAHYLLTRRHGGWPLTVFLTPDDQVPFFAGTYFPRQASHGMPAFADLMRRIDGYYRQQRDDVEKQNASLLAAMLSEHDADAGSEADLPGPAPLDHLRRQLAEAFDNNDAGFGKAPKFPHPTSLARLLQHYQASLAAGHADRGAGRMVEATLERMARGGVYDQLGGGFFRYSVDERWMIPHFEKMLYDNALLLALYSEAWQTFEQPLFERNVAATAGWVMAEMQAPEGGYWSTLDADSEGGEGSYYVWTPAQVEALLEGDERALLTAAFGLDREANFEGAWHLHGYVSVEQLADMNEVEDIDAEQLRARLDSARNKLLAARQQRSAPARDEKVLCAWNALMIRGMACAGRVFERQDYVASAERALCFVREQLWDQAVAPGRLLATYKDGEARLDAYLDDHAFLIDAILTLLEVRWNSADLDFAIALSERLLDGFADAERGGFYFTANDHESLIHRPKPFGDDALPSGNAIAASALARLGHLIGEPRYIAAAEATIKAAWPLLEQSPMGHEGMLSALADYLAPPATVILCGATGEQATAWRRELRQLPQPCALVALGATSSGLPPLLADKWAAAHAAGGAQAYLCKGHSCRPPLASVEALVAALKE